MRYPAVSILSLYHDIGPILGYGLLKARCQCPVSFSVKAEAKITLLETPVFHAAHAATKLSALLSERERPSIGFFGELVVFLA